MVEQKNIIILGMGASRVLCPYDYEVWTCNTAYRQMDVCLNCQLQKTKTIRMDIKEDKLICPECGAVTPIPRIDKIFIAHTQCWDASGDAIFNWNELNELGKRGVEIWNTHKVKGLNARFFDYRSIVRKFGFNYFANVLCFMIARAIQIYTVKDKNTGLFKLTQPLKLWLYGCDMQTWDEYGSEKGCMEAWLMFGNALGMEYEVCEGGQMFNTKTGKPYGEKTLNPNSLYLVDEKGKKHRVKMFRGKTPTEIDYKQLDKIRIGE